MRHVNDYIPSSSTDCCGHFGAGLQIDDFHGMEEVLEIGSIPSNLIEEEAGSDNGSDDDCCVLETRDVDIWKMPDTAMEDIIHSAEAYVNLVEYIQHLGNNVRFNVNYVTLLKSSLCLLAGDCQVESFNNLNDTLLAYKLTVASSDNDGLFSVFSSEYVSSQKDDSQFPSLKSSSLRDLVVNELRVHEEEYMLYLLKRHCP